MHSLTFSLDSQPLDSTEVTTLNNPGISFQGDPSIEALVEGGSKKESALPETPTSSPAPTTWPQQCQYLLPVSDTLPAVITQKHHVNHERHF